MQGIKPGWNCLFRWNYIITSRRLFASHNGALRDFYFAINCIKIAKLYAWKQMCSTSELQLRFLTFNFCVTVAMFYIKQVFQYVSCWPIHWHGKLTMWCNCLLITRLLIENGLIVKNLLIFIFVFSLLYNLDAMKIICIFNTRPPNNVKSVQSNFYFIKRGFSLTYFHDGILIMFNIHLVLLIKIWYPMHGY